MYWPEITKDTPPEEIKRIHQQIWQYVVENGKKPETPYMFDCVACAYNYSVLCNGMFRICEKCIINWPVVSNESGPCGDLFYQWYEERSKELAEKIRYIPFKYELEKKGAEE